MALIDREAAIDAVEESRRLNHHRDGKEACAHEYEHRHFLKILMELPFAEPEITDEQAIEHLQSTGWMQNHDREMYESGLREQLADDSGSYDSLILCEDTISRQVAISLPVKPREDRYFQTQSLDDAYDYGWRSLQRCIEKLPSAQTERLTDDDFETIRIHLNAYKEKLCNQQRWKEAEEYQRIIDRFMAFASAQKKGHWIDEETNYSCSECHRGCWVNSDYCPWCGAKMKR